MNTLLHRLLIGSVAAVTVVAATPQVEAGVVRYNGPKRNVTVRTGHGHHYHGHGNHYTVRYGYGYRGRGYYYGPVGARYYYSGPGVVYYPSVAAVPSTYVIDRSQERVSLEASIQIELKNRGYYKGAIDGQIGPGSRSAISRYQADKGLRVTGTITENLIDSLGIE